MHISSNTTQTSTQMITVDFEEHHRSRGDYPTFLLGREALVRVYFRLTSNFTSGRRGLDDQGYFKFRDEMVSILTGLGFSPKPGKENTCFGKDRGSSAADMIHGAERLYCHPDHLSGELLETTLEELTGKLKMAATCNHYHTDIYHFKWDMTDSEMEQSMEDIRENTTLNVFRSLRTKRTSQYFYSSLPIDPPSILEKIGAIKTDKHMLKAIDFVRSISKSLLEAGLIVTAQIDGTEHYRSLNKTELKTFVRTNHDWDFLKDRKCLCGNQKASHIGNTHGKSDWICSKCGGSVKPFH